MTREIQWVPFGKRTLKHWGVPVGFFAFVGSELIGSAYTLDGYPESNWYGTFFDDRIGSCRDEAMAKSNIGRRWKLAQEGKDPYGAV